MTAEPLEGLEPAAAAGPPQDPEWFLRYRTRLREALVILGEQDQPIKIAHLQELVAERVPLNDYDASLTASGAVRAWNNLGWNLTTTFEHAGWLHATSDAGCRVTRDGRQALAQQVDPNALYDAALAAYQAWDAARKEPLPASGGSPQSDILHGGSGAAHVMRACAPVLDAWRNGDSALLPGTPVWNPATTATLREYLDATPPPVAPTLPGLDGLAPRTMAAEALALLVGPFSDLAGYTKRSRVRNPMMLSQEPPPGLPGQLSADLEHGFVHGGKTLAAAPVAMLHSFVRALGNWWESPAELRAAGWADPWAFRDLITAAPGVDDRIAALLCLLAHPRSFTTVLRRGDRQRIIEVFADRLESPAGDVEQDLKAITLSLQLEQGGKPVRYDTAPLLQRVESGRRRQPRLAGPR